MSNEFPSRDPERLYPEHYSFGKSEPVPEGFVAPETPEGFIPVNMTVVRHHLTPYKELQDPSFVFDRSAPELNPETLDLTEQGIAGMRATAQGLAARIDPSQEVIYVISSPQYRAQSSLRVLVDELNKHGIETVNDPSDANAENLIVRDLRQTTLKDSESPERGSNAWMQAAQGWWSADPEVRKRMAPHLAHAEIAKALGHELSDILNESHAVALGRFMRTVRHVSNIGMYLNDETKESLKGRKLRVIALTHEELPSGFLQHVFDTRENLKNGQVIEIEAEGPMKEN